LFHKWQDGCLERIGLFSTCYGRGPGFEHEGRTDRHGLVNVGSERFHKGRGAGKSTTPGGHRLVSGKRKIAEKKSYEKKWLREARIFFERVCYPGVLVSEAYLGLEPPEPLFLAVSFKVNLFSPLRQFRKGSDEV
jgi:hypothetical protein